MTYFYSFLFVGLLSLIAQIIIDNTKLTPGHITSLFVVLGAFLDTFSIYDKIILKVGYGALVPITSFGHSLMHASITRSTTDGIMGIATGMFDLTTCGITFVIFISFIFALIFKPRN